MKSCYEIIGANARRIRLKSGRSQLDVANRIGKTRCSITNIEMGKQRLPLHVIGELAIALGVSAKQLMRGAYKSAELR